MVSAVYAVDHAVDVQRSVVFERRVGTAARINPLEKATGERDQLDSALVSVAVETSQVSTTTNVASILILHQFVVNREKCLPNHHKYFLRH